MGDKAEDAKAVVKKMKKEVKEKKTVYEVTNEITTCELNKGKTACKSSYGCSFIAGKDAVEAKAYKYQCCVEQKTACSKDGEKKTPTDAEKKVEEDTCKGTKTTKKKCEELSANCKALYVEGKDQAEKVEPKCVRTPCAAFSLFSGACSINKCDYIPETKASGTATYKCQADSVLTDTAKKDTCAAAKSTSCGVPANGGAVCCKQVQSNKEYKAQVSAKCTEKKTTTKKPTETTTKKPTNTTQTTTKKPTETKLTATASNMVTSITALIVALVMMS